MRKSLKSSGNGWVLYFSKPFLSLLGYNPKETNLLITSNNSVIYIEPVEDLEKYKDNMVKKLFRNSSGYALYFALPLIEVLGINPETDFLDIEVAENKLIIKKADK